MSRDPHLTASPPSQEVTHESWLRRAVAAPRVSVSPRALLTPGDVLCDRFRIVGLAGAGGMGAVYRAMDGQTRQPVAIKVVTSRELDGPERSLREARLLAELQHPCIVRYHASGTTREGCQFLVMEWLEGEDLAARLSRSRLGVEESLTLLRRVALGAAAAHARGIVHRDIKPSNIYLPGREIAASKLIDFGVARRLEDSSGLLTMPGAVLGTVGYMAPEQAMGALDLDARADVFALGCVLYECLTGRPAFSGVNAVAALLKVVREEPPRASEVLPNVHAGVDALLAKMLAKDPPRRLADAAAVLDALAELEQAPTAVAVRAPSISSSERIVASVVLGGPLRGWPERGDLASIAALTREFGAEPVATCAGALAVVFSGPIAASDLAQRAVRCALRLLRVLPELRFAVATGRTEQLTGREPTGAAIDRAAQLMAAEGVGCAEVAVDELTRNLLGPSFELRERDATWLVAAELAPLESDRLVLGKPTPFLGRDKELMLLGATLRECIEDSLAQAVLVTGPPGQGKSRLRREFMAASVRDHAGLRCVVARAEPQGERSSLSLAKRLVRSALDLRDGDEYAVLESRLAEHCPPELLPRIANFMGELLGAPCADDAAAELRAARGDPQIMSQWLRRTFGDWLAAFAGGTPLLMALDDLHWADAASLDFLSEALRELRGRPILLLAFARPEFQNQGTSCLPGTPLQRVALGRLTPRAAERLVRSVLGSVDDRALARIVEWADGNAFYLEELMRGVAHGDAGSAPENVLALVQSRLQALAPVARQVVRAASVFGEACWRDGVHALLGDSIPWNELDRVLGELVDLEVLTPVASSRFSKQLEYRFRHGLIREAAYGMLTEHDRVAGHALAGDWLERVGERDAHALTEHFMLGDIAARAFPYLIHAARISLSAGDTEAAACCAARGLLLCTTDEERGLCQLIRKDVAVLRAEWGAAVESAELAMALLPPGSEPWLHATCGALIGATFLGSPGVIAKAAGAIAGLTESARPTRQYGHAVFLATQGFWHVDRLDLAVPLLQRAQDSAGNVERVDPAFEMWLDCARGFFEAMQGRLGIGLELLARSLAVAERLGSTMGRTVASTTLLATLSATGHLERTLAAARIAREAAESSRLSVMKEQVVWYLAVASAYADGSSSEIAALRAPVHCLLERGDSSVRMSEARTLIAYFALHEGKYDQARQAAEVAFQEGRLAATQANALGLLALVELCLDRPVAALAQVERGFTLTRTGANPYTASVLHLVGARALHALGRVPEAERAIRAARERVLSNAATLKDTELRESYLRLPPNESTLRLAARWLDGAEGENVDVHARSVYGC